MNKRQQKLAQELRDSGASHEELGRLLSVANTLSLLKAQRTYVGRFRSVKPVAYLASGLVAVLALVIFSQSALPTSWLYPVQEASDDAAILVHPQYRAVVMMRRAHQVNQLVAMHASPEQITATLADYTKQASAYKDASYANYAAFEYCEDNLKQAMTQAAPTVRDAIEHSLRTVGET